MIGEHKYTYYHHLDALKGLAILLMVMAHVLAWSYRNADFLNEPLFELCDNLFYSAFFFRLTYAFHMPLLFFVSGFLFYKAIDYNWLDVKSILHRRILRILIPYIFTGVFVYALRGYFGYWFLQILFVVNCIVVIEYFLLHFAKKRIYIELVSHVIVYFALTAFVRIIGHIELPRELSNLGGGKWLLSSIHSGMYDEAVSLC